VVKVDWQQGRALENEKENLQKLRMKIHFLSLYFGNHTKYLNAWNTDF
jgi:hypothetical protein